jgi:phosphatidylglycerophosphate synthase
MAIGLAISVRQEIGVVFAWVVALAAADLFDGVLARWLGTDTNTRRLLDIVVDRMVAHTALVAAICAHPDFISLYLPIAIRDLAAAAGFLRALSRRAQLISGDRWHRASSLANAIMGLAFVSGAPAPALACAAIAWAINGILLADHAGTYLANRNILRCTPQLTRVQSHNFAGFRYFIKVLGRGDEPRVSTEPNSAA